MDDNVVASPATAGQTDPGFEDQCRQLLERCKTEAQQNTARTDRDRADYLNCLFYRGGVENHWVIWDAGAQTYTQRGHDPAKGGVPPWVPLCCTNKFANKIDGVAAILNQSQPAQLWAPATDDDDDIATADLCGDVVPVLLDEIGYESKRQQAHKLITLTDKVAFLYAYDNDAQYGTKTLPDLFCSQCAAQAGGDPTGYTFDPMELAAAGATSDTCPECGGPLEEMVDPTTGNPIGKEHPVGKICCYLVPSFELSTPKGARTTVAADLPWVMTHSRMAKEEAMRLWPHAKDAIESSAKSKTGGALARSYADALPRLAGPRAGLDTVLTGGSVPEGPVVYRLFHDPIIDPTIGEFPEGAYIIQIGDMVVECGPLPFKDDRGRPLKPVLLRTYVPAPGTVFGKPPADDLQPLQVLENLIHTLLACILLQEAAPTTFIPTSVTLIEEPTGAPGQIVRFDSLVPGDKPVRDRGLAPPEGLYKYLELLDQRFEEVSKLNAILAGQRPEGDPTLGEVEILQERGMAAFAEPLGELIQFEKAQAKLLLQIAKQSGWAPRFRKVRGENGAWEVTQFMGADLSGRVDVQVETQSAWPKSPLMQMLRLEKAVAMGVVMPPMQDPELQIKALTLLNLEHLKPSIDVFRKRVARQLDRWKQATMPEQIGQPDLVLDGPPQLAQWKYHITLFMQTEEVEMLQQANPPVYQAMRMYLQTIDLALQQQAMQQAMLQGGGPKPPPEDKRSAVEKGDQSGMQGLLESGVLQPEQPQGGSPIEGLVQAGVLQPEGQPQGQSPMTGMVESGVLMPEGQPGQGGPSIDDLMAGGVLAPAPPEEQAPGGTSADGPGGPGDVCDEVSRAGRLVPVFLAAGI